MKKQDIYTTFKNQEHAWDEMPSAAAWERLEQRLDKQQGQVKIVRFRRLAIAASLLLVLGAASVMALQTQQNKQQFAMNDYQTSDLEEDYASDVPNYEPIRYAKSSVINEGEPTRRLVAAVNYFYSDEVETGAEAIADLVVDTVRNAMKSILPAKRDFTWLLGSWVGKTAKGQSVEQWEATSDEIYDGTGFLVKNSDTLFMEQMRLQRKGDNWYYILQADAYAKSIAYKMSYYSPDFVVFENPKVAFPNQIVFDRRLGEVRSTVFLPNGKIELSPAQLDFWLQRNVLLKDKAVRNLWKA